jgi:hypothetical protein
MPCLAVFGVLAMPRFVMILLWIFSDYLSRAYDGFVLPLLGFFFLPTTTLAYAVAENEFDGLSGWGLALVIFGALLDLGIWGGGRGAFKKG